MTVPVGANWRRRVLCGGGSEEFGTAVGVNFRSPGDFHCIFAAHHIVYGDLQYIT